MAHLHASSSRDFGEPCRELLARALRHGCVANVEMLPKARDGRKADEGLCAIAQPAQLASQVGITSRRRSVVPSRASKDDELGMDRN